MRLLRLLAWRPLRRRPLRALLAIVAVAAGTAMAVSVFVVRTSVSRSIAEFGTELAGPTELRVVGAVRRGGLEPGVVDVVAGADGVAAVVPVVQAVTDLSGLEERAETIDGVTSTYRVGDRRVLVLGVDCRVEALVGDVGCTDDLVADHGDVPLAVGPGVPDGSWLQTGDGMVTLADRPVFDGLGALADGGFVVYPLPAAQRLFDRGDRLDAVYVQPEPGVDVADLRARLTDLVGEHNSVLTATDGPPEVARSLAGALPIFSLLGLFGLGIGGLLVHNTVTLSMEERRRELAVVGALGGTRRVVGRMAYGEAGALGAAGGLLGAVGGRFVAAPIVDSMSRFTESLAATPVRLHVGPGALAVGGLLGVLVSVAAAVVPARRALRSAVAGELSGQGPPGVAVDGGRPARRALVSAAATAAGVATVVLAARGGGLAPWQVPLGALGFAVVAVGLLVTGANLAPLLIRPLGHVVGDSPAGRLAVANLLRAPGRTGVMVVALAGAVATAFVTAGFSRSAEEAMTGDILRNMDGVSVRVANGGRNTSLDAPLPEDLVAVLEAMPEVAEIRRSALVLAGTGDDVVAVAAHDDQWVLDDDTDVVLGDVDAGGLAAGEAVVNTLLARSQGLRPGDTLRLPTPTGMAELPVQAVVHSGGPTGREVVLDMAVHRRLYGDQRPHAVNLRPVDGVSYDDLVATVWETLAASEEVRSHIAVGSGQLPLNVSTPADTVMEAGLVVDDTMLPFWALQRGLLVVAFVAVLSTLLLVGVQRRREMGMLAAVGTTPGGMARVVLAEAAVVGLAGAVLGVGGGVVSLWAMLEVAPLVIGFDNPFRPDWPSVLPAGGTAVLVAVLAALWPARRAARTEVVPALRYE